MNVLAAMNLRAFFFRWKTVSCKCSLSFGGYSWFGPMPADTQESEKGKEMGRRNRRERGFGGWQCLSFHFRIQSRPPVGRDPSSFRPKSERSIVAPKVFSLFFFCFASLIDSANEEKWRGAFTLLSARRLDTAGSAGLCRLARKSPVGLSPCHPFEWPAHFPPSLAVYYTIACLSSYLSFSPAINRRIFFVCFCSSTPVQVQVKVLSRQLRRVPARPHPDVT